MITNFANLKMRDGSPLGNRFDALVDAVKATSISQGRGYRVRKTALGTVLDIEPAIGGGGSTCPFEISVVAGATSGTLDVTVSPGTVNSLLPSNYADTFNVSASGLKFVKVNVTTDGAKVTSCALDVDTTAPTPAAPTPFALPELDTVAIGVIVNDTAYRMIGCGSVQLLGHEAYKVDKDPPADAGQLPYTPYYVWQQEVI